MCALATRNTKTTHAESTNSMNCFNQFDGLELWSALIFMERILRFDGFFKKTKKSHKVHAACGWTYVRVSVFIRMCFNKRISFARKNRKRKIMQIPFVHSTQIDGKSGKHKRYTNGIKIKAKNKRGRREKSVHRHFSIEAYWDFR